MGDIRVCLRCGKDYEGKRLSGKYCGDSCRVMYNRGKKAVHFKDDMERLEGLLERLEGLIGKIEIRGVVKDVGSVVVEDEGEYSFLSQIGKRVLRRGYDDYVRLKLECDSESGWNELRVEIEHAKHIPVGLRMQLLNEG